MTTKLHRTPLEKLPRWRREQDRAARRENGLLRRLLALKGIWFLSLMLALCAVNLRAGSVVADWDANPEPEVNRYTLFWGKTSGVYPSTASTSNLSVTVNASVGTNFFVLRAEVVDAAGNLLLASDFSDEVSGVVKPGKPLRLRLTGGAQQLSIIIEESPDFGTWEAIASVPVPKRRGGFYRVKE